MRVELQIGKARIVSQSRLAALLIMPLSFAPLRLAAQMIAVAPETDPAVTHALAAQTRLYLSSSDVTRPALVDLQSAPSNAPMTAAPTNTPGLGDDASSPLPPQESGNAATSALTTATPTGPSRATSSAVSLSPATGSSSTEPAAAEAALATSTEPTCFVPPTALAPTSRSSAPLLSDEAILAAAAVARPVAPVISDEDILAAATAARSTAAATPAQTDIQTNIATGIPAAQPAISPSDETLLASAAAAHIAAPVANSVPLPAKLGHPVLSPSDEALLASAAAAHQAPPPAVPASPDAPAAPVPTQVASAEIPAPAASTPPPATAAEPAPTASPAPADVPSGAPSPSPAPEPAPPVAATALAAAPPAAVAAPATPEPPPAPTAAPAPGPSPSPVTLPPKPIKARDLAQSGDRPRIRPFQAAAFGVTAGSLGGGGELAIPVASTLNLRVGASYLLWHYPFNIDGIDYNPGLKFTSGRATIDWFPHHGAFHISAGALYFRNSIGGSADVVEGQSFSLGGTSYINSVDDPIHGTATVTYGKQIAPLLLLGFGNILPRSGRHLSMPFEFGGAYMQPPILNLNLKGTACTNQGCFNAATDPEVHGNLVKEINKLQSDIHFLQVFPVVSLGLACRF